MTDERRRQRPLRTTNEQKKTEWIDQNKNNFSIVVFTWINQIRSLSWSQHELDHIVLLIDDIIDVASLLNIIFIQTQVNCNSINQKAYRTRKREKKVHRLTREFASLNNISIIHHIKFISNVPKIFRKQTSLFLTATATKITKERRKQMVVDRINTAKKEATTMTTTTNKKQKQTTREYYSVFAINCKRYYSRVCLCRARLTWICCCRCRFQVTIFFSLYFAILLAEHFCARRTTKSLLTLSRSLFRVVFITDAVIRARQ